MRYLSATIMLMIAHLQLHAMQVQPVTVRSIPTGVDDSSPVSDCCIGFWRTARFIYSLQ
jgi:hypothetical protein